MKKFWVLLVCLTLAAGTLGVYWQVRGFDFVNYDDNVYVTENSHVTGGLSIEEVVWAFTSCHMGYWQPLTWVSLMGDCQMFGVNAGRMHVVNLIFHILNTLLVLMVLKKMTGMIWPSAMAAALFAIHPMHVESVAWISERKDVLSTFFLLATLWSYSGYVKDRRAGMYLLTLLLFIMGLLCKPMLVTLPFLLLLLDYWPLERVAIGTKIPNKESKKKMAIQKEQQTWQKLMIEKIPFFLITVISSIVTYFTQQKGGGIIDTKAVPFLNRLNNVFISYASYIGKMFWPKDMAVFYSVDKTIPLVQVGLCVLLMVSVTVVIIYMGAKRKYLLTGWLWFVGTLVPVIGLVRFTGSSYGDRFTYVPYIGLFVMICWGLWDAASKRRYRKIAGGATAVMVLIAMGTVTLRQIGYWKDSESLFTHAIEAVENNYAAFNYLGVVYGNQERWQEAMEAYKQAVRIEPTYPEAQFNLAVAYNKLGLYQESIECSKNALRLKPYYAEAENNLCTVYRTFGRNEEAIEACRRAIKINPNYYEALNNLGVCYGSVGRIGEAIEACRQAIKLKPDFADAYYNLGVAYGNGGQKQEEIEAYKQVIKLKPDHANAHYNLAVLYLTAGKKGLALKEYEILKRLSPELAKSLFPDGVGTDRK